MAVNFLLEMQCSSLENFDLFRSICCPEVFRAILIWHIMFIGQIKQPGGFQSLSKLQSTIHPIIY